jgi:prophage DNA circulation protein
MDPSRLSESQESVNANKPEQNQISITFMDPSSLSESQVSVNANKPEENQISITFMDPSRLSESQESVNANKPEQNQISITFMDPSSLSESQVSVNANKPEENQISITFMDRDSYNAATKGKIEVFKNIADHYSLALLLTANKNTILHIYITALNSQFESRTPIARSESTTTLNTRTESTTNFVEEILEMCSPLLWQANVKGETPLHIAARYGHDDIVKVLIKYCAQTPHQDLEGGIEPVKEMLRMTNKEKDTALHEAVRFRHLKVVTLLIETDPNFSYSANDAGETPLYIAAERGFEDVVIEILDECKSPMHGGGGPLGRTALHAAVIWGDKYEGTFYLFSQCSTCMVNLVMNNAGLIFFQGL